jgi:hypothetical protein
MDLAIDKKIKGMNVRIFPDARYRLQWYRLDPIGPYTEYYEVYHDKRHVADIFYGKSKLYGVIFGRCTLSGNSIYRMAMHIAGMFVHPKN